jgi:hypothetical protein
VSITLNNALTGNEYEATTTIGGEATPVAAAVLELDVYNAAILIQLYTSPYTQQSGQATWQSPLFVAPSHRTFVRRGIFGARCRSAEVGKPAQVTMELLSEEETFLGFLLGAGAAPP